MPRHHQVVRREFRDDLVPLFGHDDFFFDARGAPAIRRGPECFKRKDHPRLDFNGMIERNESADHWLFPDGETDAVAVLKREAGFFIWKSKLLCLWPYGCNFSGGSSGSHEGS